MNIEKKEDKVKKQECVGRGKHISDAMYVLNGKWKFPLIFTLRQKPLRFNEILALVEGITSKVLAKELQSLQIHGLVERKVFPTKPVTILYGSTPYSSTLDKVLDELDHWGAQHLERIRQSMRNKDHSQTGRSEDQHT